MRFLNPIFFAFCLLLLSCRKDTIESEVAYDIILVAGQSNTHYGYGLDSTFDAPDESIFQLGRFEHDYQIIPAIEPLDHPTKKDSCIGFALTFAKLYRQEYLDRKRKIVIIPCGIAGSSFQQNDWNLGDNGYRDAVNRTKYVLKNHPGSKVVAVLWHQGESDEGNSSYQHDLDQMIYQMRMDILAPDVTFILGGMVPYWASLNNSLMQIQTIIKETPQRMKNCGYADPTFPFVIDKFIDANDQIHYDSYGQRELGRRYFTVFREMQ